MDGAPRRQRLIRLDPKMTRRGAAAASGAAKKSNCPQYQIAPVRNSCENSFRKRGIPGNRRFCSVIIQRESSMRHATLMVGAAIAAAAITAGSAQAADKWWPAKY